MTPWQPYPTPRNWRYPAEAHFSAEVSRLMAKFEEIHMSLRSDVRETFFCRCHHLDHMIVVQHLYSTDPEDNEFIIQPLLTPLSLWDRIACAWRYLLGRSPVGSAFAEITLDREQVERLRRSCTRYLRRTQVR